MEEKLTLENGQFITYKYIKNNSNKDYEIMYLHGFCGNMDGNKGSFIEKIARDNSLNLIKLNYLGHGTSSGKVIDFTISDWFDNVKKIIDKISTKKLILIGSSMGGWLSYLTALEYRDKIKGIVTFSTAIDFPTENIEPKIKEEDRNKEIVYEIINSDGSKSGNFITKKLLLDSKKYNLLDKDNLDIKCPVRMIHGYKDDLVPYKSALKFFEKIPSDDAEFFVVKNMNHRLSLDGNLEFVEDVISKLIIKL